jgi:bacillithiol biosynthesis cysteine-adding enzyme BshC
MDDDSGIALSHASALFRDYISDAAGAPDGARNGVLDAFYSPLRRGTAWMQLPSMMDAETRADVACLLAAQNQTWGAGTETLAQLERLAGGASAVVTGQQVGLFGGPLLTLFKAATAIRRAEDASRAGHSHVPIFWLASEDHDLAEVDHAVFPDKTSAAKKTLGSDDGLRTLHLATPQPHALPVGKIPLGADMVPLLEELQSLLGSGPAYDLLAACYRPEATYAEAFGRLLLRVFARHGLIVIDASSRPFHALARPVLRAAITQAAPLRAALLERARTLEAAGYHAQVRVAESSSLLFLLDETTGARAALHLHSGEEWKAGGRAYSTAALLDILEATPERFSPNALLRPLMQDALLPTSAYIGGPAEIAYFAQSQVLYERILGRVTPILPRLSATLIEPEIAHLLERYGLEWVDVLDEPETGAGSESLAQRLAARAMSVEGKRRLALTGEALDRELTALTTWMESVDAGLGRSARTAASKMRYQMNRMRRLAANFERERAPSLRRHAAQLRQHLHPTGHLQERVLAAAWFLQRDPEALAALLAQCAEGACDRHRALRL